MAARVGAVRAEWWNLAWGTWTMPDIAAFTQPDAITFVRSLHAYDMGFLPPVPGTINSDFYAARFTWQLGPLTAGLYTFKVSADDAIRMFTVRGVTC